MPGDLWSAHGINPAMQGIKTTGPDPVIDRVSLISHGEKLIPRHHAVLIARQLPSLPRHPHPFPPPFIGRLLSYSGHNRVKSARALDSPPYPAAVRASCGVLDHAEAAAYA